MDELVHRAAECAALAHDGHYRKGTRVPYLSHPCRVALLLTHVGAEGEVIAAGLLHDTVEDTPVTLAEIEERFGARVAAIVRGCSEEDKALPWEERKRHTLAALPHAPAGVRLVSCADKLDNVRSMALDEAREGPALWSRFRRGRERRSLLRSTTCCAARWPTSLASTAGRAVRRDRRQFQPSAHR